MNQDRSAMRSEILVSLTTCQGIDHSLLYRWCKIHQDEEFEENPAVDHVCSISDSDSYWPANTSF
jgi:hypothetical protein